MKRVLVLNAGSSTLKWALLDAATEAIEDQGNATWQSGGTDSHGEAARALLARLPPVDAVGHRVVHGGARFREAVVIDAAVRQAIAELAELAPLHNPAALAGIEAVSAVYPHLPQVAAFDTAFHHTMPEAAAIYAVPAEWTARYGLRRFGFHGLSVSYAVRRAHELLGALPQRLVVCHLGAGCSITAVAGGRSVDTSMGFTPLEGVVMATRSGTIDPGMMLYLLTRQGMTPDDLDQALNHQAGLLGVSGISDDLRQVLAKADEGHAGARLAVAIFVHSLVRAVGAMSAVLGGLDAIVYTGGIGEHSARIRAELATALGYLGLHLDASANARRADADLDIAAPDSAVRALAITAREDLAVLAEMRRLLSL